MGLDMYLEKRTYVKNWSWTKPEEYVRVTVTRGGILDPTIDSKKVTHIVEEAGQWRKANAIHQWFVTHVQEGNDDCGYYYVSHEQLQELLDAVDIVLDSSSLQPGRVHVGTRYPLDGEPEEMYEDGEVIIDYTIAETLLPTQSGFFFGSTQYDEGYLEDLKLTKDILEEALKDESGDYYYHSSW